jgi:hypothetical protein
VRDVEDMIHEYLEEKINLALGEAQKLILREKLVQFIQFFNIKFCESFSLEKRSLSMRDILSILDFIANFFNSGLCSLDLIYQHALEMNIVDSIGILGLVESEKARLIGVLKEFIADQAQQIREITNKVPACSS